MADPARFVIVGAGLAGAKTAESLRARGFEGRIVLLGDEPHAPYERPPLSKDYLQGNTARDDVFVHPDRWYADNEVDLRRNTPVAELDPRAHRIRTAAGEELGYDKLLLATGARPKHLPVAGADLEGVHTLRTVDDSERLREVLTAAGRIVIIGAGWIGLEVAAAARLAGVDVTVVEAESLPLLRVLGPELAQVFADLHREHDVDLRFSADVRTITGDRRATGVRLDDGTELDADAVLVGIGAAPNTQLAEDGGLTVDDGVVVDAGLRSSDPDVFAAGDVARAHNTSLGAHVRVEHWANAQDQPATAAAAMLGEDAHFEALPFFFTDQHDLGMEYTGHADGYDEIVIRGDTATREFVAFWLQQGRVLAGMNVNTWDVSDTVGALIRSRARVDLARLADRNVALSQLLPG